MHDVSETARQDFPTGRTVSLYAGITYIPASHQTADTCKFCPNSARSSL